MTLTVKQDLVVIEDRQRKEISPKELLDLKISIATKGLFHAPVMSVQDTEIKLVAGERRYKAMCELHLEGTTFKYNDTPVPLFEIPYVRIGDLSSVDLMEAELEENILRAPLTWLEECEAKAKIHELRKELNPSQTFTDTARHIISKVGADETVKDPVAAVAKDVSAAVLIAKHKNDPAVRSAKNARQAQTAILDKLEAAMRAKLVQQTKDFKPKHFLLRGDCRDILPTMPDEQFDLIFSDPPYGINADTAKGDSKHWYDDSPENALNIYKTIISQGFRVAKRKAALLLWADIDFFVELRTYAAQHGWTCWRTPLIMFKGQQGHAPWGRAGFIRSYEILLYAVKGQRELYSPGGPDVLDYPSIHRNRLGTEYTNRHGRIHAAEKPVLALTHYLSRILLEGQTVLDPCCGSGSIFPAAENVKAIATGIELSEHYYNVAASRLSTMDGGLPDETDIEEDTSGDEGEEDEEDERSMGI